MICEEIGLPSGVLNIITGLGPEAGAPIASHPNVARVLTMPVESCTGGHGASKSSRIGRASCRERVCQYV